MTTTNFVVLATLLLVGSTVGMKMPSLKGSLNSPAFIQKEVIDALKKYDNPISEQLQQMITISMSEGAYTALFRLLNEIRSDLASDLVNEGNRHSGVVVGLEAIISTHFNAYTAAEKARNAAQSKINTLTSEINGLNGEIDVLTQSIQSTQGNMDTLYNQRQADIASYNARSYSHDATVEALGIIIGDLEHIDTTHEGTSFAEVQKVIKEMKQIGKSNPLLSLVKFSTTFDQSTMNDVLGKLRAIRSAAIQSGADDDEDERQSAAWYDVEYNKYQALFDSETKQKSDKVGTVGQKTTQRTTATEDRNREEGIYQTNLAAHTKKEGELVSENTLHDSNVQQIQSEQSTVQTAYDILEAKLGYVEENEDTITTDAIGYVE